MIVVGADVHKRSRTFVAVDEVGRKLGAKTVKVTTEGHVTAVMWARAQFGTELRCPCRSTHVGDQPAALVCA